MLHPPIVPAVAGDPASRTRLVGRGCPFTQALLVHSAAVKPRPAVTVVSPHFDDVPLSLGQSLRDGALSSCDVSVEVVFGRTNWTNWVHPTRSRAGVISGWRRLEEALSARCFGYRWHSSDWEEALLRWGVVAGGDRLLDPGADLSAEPLVDQIGEWLVNLVNAPQGAPALVLVPAGIGGHVDHRIVALAAVGVRDRLGAAVGFYEDRPYVSHMDPGQVEAQLDALGLEPELDRVAVSGPIAESTQKRVRRCYPSQIDGYFVEAMHRDVADGSSERVWFEQGTAPVWFG